LADFIDIKTHIAIQYRTYLQVQGRLWTTELGSPDLSATCAVLRSCRPSNNHKASLSSV